MIRLSQGPHSVVVPLWWVPLASEEARNITGHMLMVAGGLNPHL